MDPTTPVRFFPPFLGEYGLRDRDTSAKKAFSRLRFEKCTLMMSHLPEFKASPSSSKTFKVKVPTLKV